jgi:hypothetical protein
MSFVPRYEDDDAPVYPQDEFILNLPDEEAPPGDPNADRLARIEAALERPKAPAYEETYQPPATPAYVPQTHVGAGMTPELRAQLEQEAILKPVETMQKFSQAAYQMAEQNFNAKLIPMQASLVKQNIHSYKQAASMAPEVAKEFDKLVKSIPDSELAKVDPSTITNHLDRFHDMAYGAAARQGYIPEAARSKVPNYGGGSSAAPMPGFKQKAVKVTPLQREAIQMARDVWGWDDKMIDQGMRDGTFNEKAR